MTRSLSKPTLSICFLQQGCTTQTFPRQHPQLVHMPETTGPVSLKALQMPLLGECESRSNPSVQKTVGAARVDGGRGTVQWELRGGRGTWDSTGGGCEGGRGTWDCFRLQGVCFQGDENILNQTVAMPCCSEYRKIPLKWTLQSRCVWCCVNFISAQTWKSPGLGQDQAWGCGNNLWA